MCRAIVYIGEKTNMYPFTHLSHNSLLNQSTNPKYMRHGFNLTGNGFICWQHHANKKSKPILYKSKLLPFYDYVFEMQAKNIETDCFITHIRGGALSSGVVLTAPNAHPFLFEGTNISLAHNGGLHNGTIEQQLAINTEISRKTAAKWYSQIRGTTDSEYIYALLLTCLDNYLNQPIEKALANAVFDTFDIIKKIRTKFNVRYASPVNLFIANGDFISVVRYTFDFGLFNDNLSQKHMTFYSLWYTYGKSFEKFNDNYQMVPGKKSSICFASEPLSKDTSSWLEVPEYSIITIKKGKPLKMTIDDIDL